MGEQDHIQASLSIAAAGRGTAAHLPPAKKTHGDIVVDAITGPTRVLIAAVITVNLSIGAFWIERADFSAVKPQGSGVEAPAGIRPAEPHLPLHLPLAEASAASVPKAAMVAHTAADEHHELSRRDFSRRSDPK